MRLTTFYILTIVVSLFVVQFGRDYLPFVTSDTDYIVDLSVRMAAAIIVESVLLLILTPLNNRLRDWNGRDIDDLEEEERLEELNGGMIRLDLDR